METKEAKNRLLVGGLAALHTTGCLSLQIGGRMENGPSKNTINFALDPHKGAHPDFLIWNDLTEAPLLDILVSFTSLDRSGIYTKINLHSHQTVALVIFFCSILTGVILVVVYYSQPPLSCSAEQPKTPNDLNRGKFFTQAQRQKRCISCNPVM